MEAATEKGEMSFSQPSDDTLLVRLAGSWKITQALPSADEVLAQLESSSRIEQNTFDTRKLTDWDSGLLTFLIKVMEQSSRHKIHADTKGLPQGVQRLLELATAVPEKEDARKTVKDKPFLEQTGDDVVEFMQSTGEMMAFIGEAFVAITKMQNV